MKYRSGDIGLDTQLQRAYKHGRELSLSPLTFRLLHTLLESPLAVVSADELARRVWERHSVSDEAISQRISLLRKALDETGREYIESIRGRGYRWKQPVETVSSEPMPIYVHRFTRWSVAAALSLIIMGVTYWRLSGDFEVIQPSQQGVQLPQHMQLLEQAQRYQAQFNEKGFTIARDLYRQVLEAHPDSYEAQFGLTVSLLHRVAKVNGDPLELQQAAHSLDRLFAEFPVTADLLWLKGFYYDVAGALEQAILWYEKALAEGPEYNAVKGNLAYLYIKKGRLYDALQLNGDSNASPQQYGLLQTAEILYLSGLTDEAERLFSQADLLSPDNAFASSGRAQFLIALGRDSEAEEVIGNALGRGVHTHDLYLLQGILHSRKANWKLAQEAFESARRYMPASVHVAAWNAWVSLQTGEPLETPWLETESQSDLWPNVWVSNAILAVTQENYDEARRYLDYAVAAGFMEASLLKAMPPFNMHHEKLGLDHIEHVIQRRAQTERIKILAYAWPQLNEVWPRE